MWVYGLYFCYVALLSVKLVDFLNFYNFWIMYHNDMSYAINMAERNEQKLN